MRKYKRYSFRMQLIVFHYHFMTGGVTSVILWALEALAASTKCPFDSCQLVSGEGTSSEKIIERLCSRSFVRYSSNSHQEKNKNTGLHGQQSAIPLAVDTHPILGYLSLSSQRELFKTIKQIKLLLRERYLNTDSLWWIHNWHLGKNIAFTTALFELLKEEPQQRIMLQLHDFPEQGRAHNMEQLHRLSLASLYPYRSRMVYIFINSHDRRAAVQSGLPSRRVALLPNPLNIKDSLQVARQAAIDKERRDHIRKWFTTLRRQNTRSSVEHIFLLYPVRAIRRKNIIESALLVTLLNRYRNTEGPSEKPERCYSLITTLQGRSKDEQGYSALIAQLYHEGLIDGIWNIAPQLERESVEYHELLASVDFLISSSILEGFGYTFAEALTSCSRLICRKIAVCEDFAPYYATDQLLPYENLMVDWNMLSDGHHKQQTYRGYLQQLKRYRTSLSDERYHQLTKDVEQLFDNQLCDYSYLSIPAQVDILRQIASHKKIEEMVGNNRALLTNLINFTRHNHRQPSLSDKFIAELRDSRFVARFNHAVTSLEDKPTMPVCNSLVDQAIEERMCTIDYLRPLTWPFTGV